jgi:ATP-dependent RNA helicase DDX1
MGLAISLVSKVHEKVWYHTCQSKGKNCLNTLLKDDGGCCIWYNEMQYLDDIEEHLGVTIAQVPSTLEVPVDEFDGKVVYGEKKKVQQSSFKGHIQILQPTVTELTQLEKKAQLNFLNLKYNKSLLGL